MSYNRLPPRTPDLLASFTYLRISFGISGVFSDLLKISSCYSGISVCELSLPPTLCQHSTQIRCPSEDCSYIPAPILALHFTICSDSTRNWSFLRHHSRGLSLDLATSGLDLPLTHHSFFNFDDQRIRISPGRLFEISGLIYH